MGWRKFRRVRTINSPVIYASPTYIVGAFRTGEGLY